MTPDLSRLLAWQHDGTARLEAAVAALSDEQLLQPCALPGWRRTHLVAHLARNADALVNLLDWAATGHPNPMYADVDQRTRDIEASAAQPLADLRQDLLSADKRYADAIEALPDHAWATRVRSALGRDIPATDVPWLRVREVWIHLVDLAGEPTFADLPADLVTALLTDVATAFNRKPGAPGLRLIAEDKVWTIGSPSTTIRGPAPALLGWLTGRSTGAELNGPLPTLPPWL
ncbi:maleylpyruvate isomerase family mycothiol-dependent enzyme [Amycolatopsis sp. FDAARGOS 1241]|uniref:maleylpyruvate isomerase family mycothiol-dependent enzyme n=1 Tax=Amycolatopsis sp. FDAARGOS 1241 TaxID=2778070 RepID=UPI00194DDB32|nr:maleylpyruvate isomerase family mycothiol-dependent enzyme [Amycolatopsis sp. FDAARGOS 1241]QRP49072.1 maleylpyruvate isomerase family mycothiol-dependent enzyme [Amycolatopsis sp. FDAARGOS 1241]